MANKLGILFLMFLFFFSSECGITGLSLTRKGNIMKKNKLLIWIVLIAVLLGACRRNDSSGTFAEGSSASESSGETVQVTGSASPELPETQPDSSDLFARFRADTADIHVGQTVRVTFCASLSPDRAVSDPVVLESEFDGILGELKDDGIAPDGSAHDGIYTGVFDLTSSVRKNEAYRAVCGSSFSEPVQICFYRDLTQQDFDQMNAVLDKIDELDGFEKIAAFLSASPDIEWIGEDPEHGSITFTTVAGITGVWTEAWDGQGKGGMGFGALPGSELSVDNRQRVQAQPSYNRYNRDIAVIRPFHGSDFPYENFRECAEKIAKALGGSVTVKDDEEATLDFMKHLDDYGMVLFDTHGLLPDLGNSAWSIMGRRIPFFMLGEKAENFWDRFSDADWQKKRIIIATWADTIGGENQKEKIKRIAVGSQFFEDYYADGSFDDTVFFLGSCYSMTDTSLAEVLKRKGASVVFGYSDTVSHLYCNDTLDEILFQSMTRYAATSGTAFENARNIHGSSDPHEGYEDCELRIFGDRDYRIASLLQISVLDQAGRAIPDASVLLKNTDLRNFYVKPNSPAGDDGLFRTGGIPNGKYVLSAEAEHFLTNEIEIEVQEDACAVITLAKLGELECHAVTKGNASAPLAGVTLTLIRDGKSISAESDENGRIFVQDLEEGHYELEFTLFGYKTVKYTDILIEYDRLTVPPFPIEMEREALLLIPGDVIEFGRYEQNGDLKNGPEPIQWQVLAVEDGKALVISRFGLDSRAYNEEYTAITWKNCSLRKWLNEEFLAAAFSEEEQKFISLSHIVNHDNPSSGKPGGNDTEDKLFLLSIEEAETYFASDDDRRCWTTSYVMAREPKMPRDADGCCWWWLRSPGGMPQYAVDVMPDGEIRTISGANVDVIWRTVRPAFWIDLTSPDSLLTGQNITWSIKDGVLTISGSGKMKDYDDNTLVPWYECRTAVRTVVIDDRITHVGKYAFFGCRNMMSASLPKSLESIGDYAFYLCDKLTGLSVPEGVTSIGYQAFCSCLGLTELTLPDSLREIADGAFTDCENLKEIVIPEGVERIGSRTFMKCFALTSVVFPGSLHSIESYAFTWCRALTSVIIPNGVIEIGKKAFDGCGALEEITIPAGVKTIHEEAFTNCGSLKDINYDGSEADWKGIFHGSLPEDTAVHFK